MQLTKTDFIQYLECPNSLWLLKNKPEVFEKYKGEKSLFLEKLIRDGYEVEEYVEKLYSSAKDIGNLDPVETKEFLSQKIGKFFQATLKTSEGVLARVDMLEIHPDNTISLYEVKSSVYEEKKGVKSYDKKHFKDLAFQKYVLEKEGYVVRDIYLIYLDKSFTKNGEIEPEDLLHVGDVSEQVINIFDTTLIEIESALRHINNEEINENLCTCLDKTRSNHCETFTYFNKDIPEASIYELNNIRAGKIQQLQDMAVIKITDIPDDFELSEYQLLQKESHDQVRPIIDKENIQSILDKLVFPLYFFDYETLPSAIPKVDRYWPHAHLPTQYSLHVLQEDGSMKHFEYLADKMEAPKKLIESMKKCVGNVGSFVSWSKSYEQGKNREMAELYPEYADFLHDINARTWDLMDIFKKDYVDAKFEGSNSIKKVQPVLVPNLSYKDLEVQSGTMAADAAERLYNMTDPVEIQKLRVAMLEYCRLDTLAMVEIFNKLKLF